jgi:hypothetical protein
MQTSRPLQRMMANSQRLLVSSCPHNLDDPLMRSDEPPAPTYSYSSAIRSAPLYNGPHAPSGIANETCLPSYGGHYSSTYQQSHTTGAWAPVQHCGSSYDHIDSEVASGVRVVNDQPKPQCWDHGCNGRQFSTYSNLLRHQREKSGKSTVSTCPRCGAQFTRTTALRGIIYRKRLSPHLRTDNFH